MLLLLLLSSDVVITQLFFYFCCCRPFRISRNKYKPIWPQQQHHHYNYKLTICDDCGLSDFLATGEHNSAHNAPRTAQGKDVNLRVVYAASEMGIDRGHISKFCKIFFDEQRYLAQSCISYSTL